MAQAFKYRHQINTLSPARLVNWKVVSSAKRLYNGNTPIYNNCLTVIAVTIFSNLHISTWDSAVQTAN